MKKISVHKMKISSPKPKMVKVKKSPKPMSINKKWYLGATMCLAMIATVQAGDTRIINTRRDPVPTVNVGGTISGTFTSGVPAATVADNDSTQTAATGTNWTAFASHAGAKQVMIFNQTGTAISFRYGSGTAISLPDNSVIVVSVIANTNELEIKRTDDSNSQVVVTWHYEG